jgi:hypothetical protein
MPESVLPVNLLWKKGMENRVKCSSSEDVHVLHDDDHYPQRQHLTCASSCTWGLFELSYADSGRVLGGSSMLVAEEETMEQVK